MDSTNAEKVELICLNPLDFGAVCWTEEFAKDRQAFGLNPLDFGAVCWTYRRKWPKANPRVLIPLISGLSVGQFVDDQTGERHVLIPLISGLSVGHDGAADAHGIEVLIPLISGLSVGPLNLAKVMASLS